MATFKGEWIITMRQNENYKVLLKYFIFRSITTIYIFFLTAAFLDRKKYTAKIIDRTTLGRRWWFRTQLLILKRSWNFLEHHVLGRIPLLTRNFIKIATWLADTIPGSQIEMKPKIIQQYPLTINTPAVRWLPGTYQSLHSTPWV